ncbi:hypothetical protein B0H10DRAFT_2020614 [Mycena sp. CBHHK59/15]|nr:hypothetical protein B0H10DRAFT_2020614 [Mycena sp. CBHHK59/15]
MHRKRSSGGIWKLPRRRDKRYNSCGTNFPCWKTNHVLITALVNERKGEKQHATSIKCPGA